MGTRIHEVRSHKSPALPVTVCLIIQSTSIWELSTYEALYHALVKQLLEWAVTQSRAKPNRIEQESQALADKSSQGISTFPSKRITCEAQNFVLPLYSGVRKERREGT